MREGNEQGKPSWSTNSSASSLWTSATGINRLVSNRSALASGVPLLGDGDSIKPALAPASASTPMRPGVGLWSHMRALLSVESSACRNQKDNNHKYMTNIKLIALIAGAAVLAGAPALILPRILRAPRPRRSRPDSMRKNGKIPNSKNSITALRRPHAIPA